MNSIIKYAGIDGCPAGWIIVSGTKYSKDQNIQYEHWNIQIFEKISQLWEEYKDFNLILIDIPIGLKEKETQIRECDKKARKYLDKRSSTIFPVPCRQAIYANTYQEANKINRHIIGKGVSKQSWNISQKIKEMDQLIRKNRIAKTIFIESHPEVCFASLVGDNPLKFSKKSSKGIKIRTELLKSYSPSLEKFIEESYKKFKRKNVKKDDVLDAIILALSAELGRSKISFFPKKYNFDQKGIPMRISYPQFSKRLKY